MINMNAGLWLPIYSVPEYWINGVMGYWGLEKIHLPLPQHRSSPKTGDAGCVNFTNIKKCRPCVKATIRNSLLC